jgi:hypothetical protein
LSRVDGVAGVLRWRRLPAVVEAVSILLGYGLYSLVRLLSPHQLYASYTHAYAVLHIERATGLFHELRLNLFLSKHPGLEDFASYWYATAHFVVTPLVLIWLFRYRPRAYPMLRSSLVLATVGALVVYATWPLAPPRFVVSGAVDTVLEHPVIWAKQGAAGFVNEFAAMPSLHVGWAVWCALAAVAVLRTRWRHLAWLYPLTTTLVVIATANHYLLDAVAGVVVVLVPMWLCGLRPQHLVTGLPAHTTLSRSAPGAEAGTAGRRGAVGASLR